MGDNSIASLPRQMGLFEATQIIANNIANASTPGYKAEGTIFAEHVARAGYDNPSLSMGHLIGHSTDFSGGAMLNTGNTFDLAIDGPGFFKINIGDGTRLTRAGAFQLDGDGMVVDAMGNPVVDEGGSAIQIPPDSVQVSVAKDGTLSVDGEIFSQIGVFRPNGEPVRAGSNYWEAPEGDVAVEEPIVLQGFLEQSNVSMVAEFAKLIATQRLFEAGQNLAEQEHDRLTSLVNAIRQQG